MRMVPDQDAEKMYETFAAWVASTTPKGIQTKVRKLSGGPAVVVNPAHPAIDKAAEAFAEVLGRKTVFIRSGGSVPIVGDFANHLGIPTVMMGFGLPDDGLHSPNEKFKLENFYLGTQTVADFLEKYGLEKYGV
jgi:acetylornithine deacetylase/succinyl-diaminopimelate desuccinylase-like protein